MAADANEEEEESITINDEEVEEEEALYLHNFRDMTAYRLTHEALEKERALFENLRGAGYVRSAGQRQGQLRDEDYEGETHRKPPGADPRGCSPDQGALDHRQVRLEGRGQAGRVLPGGRVLVATQRTQ